MSVTKVCVLRSGGDFEPRHVQWLAKQVPGLVCLSDQKIAGVETIPLQTDWPGWWSKMEAYGPSIDGDMLLIDLDTVVLRMPDMPTETTVLRDFTKPHRIGSGFMYVTAEDRARVWEAFTADPKGHMRRHQAEGDQGFLFEHLAGAARWQDIAKVYSYKCDIRGRGLPANAEIVCYHGRPRPWQVKEPWVPKLA